jgi:hypothetical protein
VSTETESRKAASDLIYSRTWNSTTHAIPEKELLALTALLRQCPEWWEHPCMCESCRSYGGG